MPTTRTYSPLPPMIPAEDIFCTNPCGPREPNPCPHTYGVRVCSCAAFATDTCRPTACTMPSPYPSTDHCSLLGYRYASPDGDGFPVTYSVTHSHTDHSSLITVHSSYTFSAKERDAETGLTYFGARYYSSDLSIWLSVDPMAAKYPSSSPYVYCADNPVKLTDPDGRWIPGLDEDGNVTYTAEKGDSFDTFNRQFECRDANGQYKDANGVLISTKIFNNAKLSTTGQIKEGAIIKGAHVKEATNGSSVLKGNWHKMNDSQKASQVMFALMYGANKGTTLPNGIYGVDLNDFIIGFYSKDGGTQYSNVSIPLKGGDKIVVDMWLAPSSTIEGKNGSLWVRSSVEWGSYNNAMSRYPARVYSAKNVNAQYPFVVILFSVPESKQGDFDNSLRK